MAGAGRKLRDSMSQGVKGSGLAKGTVTNALMTAITRLLFFVLIPAWLLGIFISIAHSDLDPSAPLFIEAVTKLRDYVVFFGIPIAVVAGLWEYHLRGSRARLYFGLLGSALLVLYGAALLLTAPIQLAQEALGWFFPTWLAFGLVCYRATRHSLRFLRDYLFFRERARRKEAKDDAPPPFKPTLGRGEFNLRLGTLSHGATHAEKFIRSTVTRFPFWMLLIVWLLSVFGFGQTENSFNFLRVLTAMGTLFLLVGIPMTIIAFFIGFFPKGSLSRSLLDLTNSLLFILLIFWIFVGSGLSKVITDSGLIIPLGPIILAIIIWAVIDVIRVGAEFRDERRTWLKAVGHEVPPKRKKRFQIPPESKWYDFNPSIGRFSRGTIDAKHAVLRFVTVPELVILLTLGILRSAGATGYIYEIMQHWTFSVLLWGLVIGLVAFWRGYFPAGTWSRLLFGLMLVPALILYVVRGLEIGGSLDEALKAIGLVVPMEQVNLLILIMIAFVGVLQIGDFGDSRRSWRIAAGKSVRPYKPIKRMSRLHEFRVRFASKRNGMIWMRKGMVRYVYYTSIFILFLITLINSAVFATIGLDLTPLGDRLNGIFLSLILIAIPLAAARAFYGFYYAGSTSKLVFGFVMAFAGAAYTYTGLRGGRIGAVGEWGTVTAGFSVEFVFLVVLFFIGWGIWCLVVLVEYLSYRKAWIANDYQPVESAEVEERLAIERLISKEEKRVTRLDARARRRAARRAMRKGTSVQEEEVREVAAAEADVRISEVDEEAEEEEAGESETEEEVRKEVGPLEGH